MRTAIFSVLFVFVVHANAWTVKNRADEFTDKQFSYLFSDSSNIVTSFREKAIAVIKCDRSGMDRYLNGIDVYFGWHEYLDDDGINVSYRFDKNKAITSYFNSSTDGKILFVKNENLEKFISNMMSSNLLIIKAFNFQGTSTTAAKFSLSGFTNAFKKACGKQYAKLISNKKKHARASNAVKEYDNCLKSNKHMLSNEVKMYCDKKYGAEVANAWSYE